MSNQYYNKNYYNSTAPKIKKQKTQAKTNVRVYKKTKKQLKMEERRAFALTLQVLLISIIVSSICGVRIYFQVRKDETARQLDAVNEQISVAQSENTRLKMDIEETISLDKVDSYAMNVLGMVKIENYQVQYVDVNEGDEVIIYDVGDDTLLTKVKNILIKDNKNPLK